MEGPCECLVVTRDTIFDGLSLQAESETHRMQRNIFLAQVSVMVQHLTPNATDHCATSPPPRPINTNGLTAKTHRGSSILLNNAKRSPPSGRRLVWSFIYPSEGGCNSEEELRSSKGDTYVYIYISSIVNAVGTCVSWKLDPEFSFATRDTRSAMIVNLSMSQHVLKETVVYSGLLIMGSFIGFSQQIGSDYQSIRCTGEEYSTRIPGPFAIV